MGELKGQLLSILTVLVVFGAIAGTIYAGAVSLKDKINAKNESALTDITKPQKQDNLLSFKY